MQRLSWDAYFMNIARLVATRSTCERKQVGAVFVRNRIILSTGYNGSMRGATHCEGQAVCMEGTPNCQRTVHAEINAVAQAARSGAALEGAEVYISASPCWNCFKALVNAGVTRIVYGEFYRDDRIFRAAEQLGIQLVDGVALPKLVFTHEDITAVAPLDAPVESGPRG